MKSSKPEIKRILLCRLGGIGDVIHTLPLVKYLKSEFKNASIEYLTSYDIADLLVTACPYIDRVWGFDKKNKTKIASDILSNSKIDYFFNLHSSLSFFFFNLFYIKAKRFFQYKKDNNVHAVINFAKTYEPSISAFNLDSKTLFINQSKDILSEFNLKENKFICFVPGVGRVRMHRGWPIENWVSLTKNYLERENDFKVVYLGGKDEERIVGFLPSIDNQTVNLIGKLSLFDNAKIISSAFALVSCDTGLLHLASALSTKVIGLYGPTLPKRSGPFTSDYQILSVKNCSCIGIFKDIKKCKKTKDNYGYCMNKLTVNDVLSNITYNFVPAL